MMRSVFFSAENNFVNAGPKNKTVQSPFLRGHHKKFYDFAKSEIHARCARSMVFEYCRKR